MVIALGLSGITFTILLVFWKLCNASADLIHVGVSELRNSGVEQTSGEDHR